MKNKSNFTIAFSTILLSLTCASAFAGIAADNTKINHRDDAANELTADQQGSSNTDLSITSRIREEIIKNKHFSTYAHNIKIITLDGRVTLKGPVRSMKEKNKIYKLACAEVGTPHVVNEIAIVKKRK